MSASFSPHTILGTDITPFVGIDVKNFGAVGNGTSDDTAAINAALAYVRSVVTASPVSYGQTTKLIFPPGTYLVSGTLNATGITAVNTVLEGYGAVIWGKVSGAPVLDALGSRWLKIRGLTIWGDASTIPSIGLQIGRVSSGVSAGEGGLTDVFILGTFTVAAFYNLAAEVMRYDHCQFHNLSSSATAFVTIMDANNSFGITSAFITENISQGVSQSFNDQSFRTCFFYRPNGGKVIKYFGGSSCRGHDYDDSCYMQSTNDAGVYITGTTSMADMIFKMHIETTGAVDYLLFDTSATGPTVYGLQIHDYAPDNSGSIINISSNANKLTIYDLDAHIGLAAQNIPMFGASGVTSTNMVVTGRIHWNGPTGGSVSNAAFTGELYNGATLTKNDSLPTSDPHIAGQWYSKAGAVTISAG